MLRDKNLVPLSRQHQHALALCVFIERALREPEADLVHWQAEIERQFANEIRFHFEAEEKVLFPAVERFDILMPLVKELLGEHAALRDYAARAARQELGREHLLAFAQTLSEHVRKEERQLFEQCQATLRPEELAVIGASIMGYFQSSGMPPESCGLE
jgi:hemerythrin-like domain-containing protein